MKCIYTHSYFVYENILFTFAHEIASILYRTMKSKALGNLEVAQLLINNKNVCSSTASIHCSYYAVFQYMKYMLANTDRNPISYDVQSEKTKEQNSHEYMISEIRQRISKEKYARDFVQDVRALKKERIDADYNAKEFSVEESLECKEQAERLISKLKTYFGNK